MTDKDRQKKKLTATIFEAECRRDGREYVLTRCGDVLMVQFLLDVMISGGSWQTIYSYKSIVLGVSTIVIKLFVMIPDGSSAAKYLQGEQFIQNGDQE